VSWGFKAAAPELPNIHALEPATKKKSMSPDTPIEWRDVWLGAILTAALFEGGPDRPVHWQARSRIDLRRRGFDRGRAHLGLLLRAARLLGAQFTTFMGGVTARNKWRLP
jgi:hypothetical protein